MTKKRKVEVFSAGCAVCEEVVALVKSLACSSCDIVILNMQLPDVSSRAKALGIRSVPAVVIDGKLADCCSRRRPDTEVLKAAGLGQPLQL